MSDDAPSARVARQPTFYDLISSDGNFDVYRYQSFLFSAAVGGALFIGGISQTLIIYSTAEYSRHFGASVRSCTLLASWLARIVRHKLTP